MKICIDPLYKYLSLVSFALSVENKLETNQLSAVLDSSPQAQLAFSSEQRVSKFCFVVTKSVKD